MGDVINLQGELETLDQEGLDPPSSRLFRRMASVVAGEELPSCPNCGWTRFSLEGVFTTEYHDAAICFKGSLINGRLSRFKAVREGSFDIDSLEVRCRRCGWAADLGELEDYGLFEGLLDQVTERALG